MRSMIACLFACFALVACSKQPPPAPPKPPQSPAAPAGPTFEPVATVKQVMQAITVPASNIVFGVAAEAPADDAGWLNVENGALAVAESANLLMMEPRAIDQQTWRQHALEMLEAAKDAAEAARSRDSEKLSEISNMLYETCEGCHRQYMQPSDE